MAVLGYWDIRGLAHAIRLLLEHTETPYEDKLYSCGEAPDYDKSQWINEKEKLGLDFPNLPYFIDGSTKLTQSNAILRYIARKHNMCGETEEEKLRVDMLENQVVDFRMSLIVVCYSPDFEKLKLGYLEQLPGKLKLFSNFLGDRKWFAGDKVRPGSGAGGGVPTLPLTVCVPPPPPAAHFRGLPHVRRAGAEQHLRAQVPGALQEPQGLHGPLWGPGEGRCLHEVQPLPEDAHQRQDGQVGQQEGVGVGGLAHPLVGLGVSVGVRTPNTINCGDPAP
ncbi:glutathione S-transferase Mu 1-like isoform X1 [Cygnus atratus]|uniref:glutathione S-transferase Mu 1-like isoform X2 n=1 Tax=Cygnus atratus TaxID=8868 RepID=UPI0015D5CDBC|nr:glutathione S-transferase Mu 1-like isoform X2 [Cygnus atratus]XP_035426527.1 glutathione S-transferase Mu 1-like isoform X1 [Cygnus atratus]